MTLSFPSKAVDELYSVLARQGSPQEAAGGELRVVELVGQILGPGGHRPPVGLDAGAQVEQVHRLARGQIFWGPPGAAAHLRVEAEPAVHSAPERLVDLEARVGGVLRQERRL